MSAQLERLSAEHAATDLHYDAEDGCIWLDPDGREKNGLVIGVGNSRELAIRDAIQELQDRLTDLWMSLTPKRESARPCGCDPGCHHTCDEHETAERQA